MVKIGAELPKLLQK